MLWLFATIGFGWYVRNMAHYNVLYGSVGTSIALLVWMYLISLVILIGAEFNAILYPRARLGMELTGVGNASPAAM